MTDELEQLRTSLLRGLRVDLTPEQGDEAFERHQLLAIRLHRAARLNQTGKGEGAGWQQYFDEHFPRGGTHAGLLWENWRVTLLKDEMPGEGVVITHCRPDAHWQPVEPGGRLCLNLESMWDEFEASVDHLVESLRSDAARRKVVLKRWRERRWRVETVWRVDPDRYSATGVLATSVTARREPRE